MEGKCAEIDNTSKWKIRNTVNRGGNNVNGGVKIFMNRDRNIVI